MILVFCNNLGGKRICVCVTEAQYWHWKLTWHVKSSVCVCVCVRRSIASLCDPMDCSPPGSSVHQIYFNKIKNWKNQDTKSNAIDYKRRFAGTVKKHRSSISPTPNCLICFKMGPIYSSFQILLFFFRGTWFKSVHCQGQGAENMDREVRLM